MPYERNPHFTGRDELLVLLNEKLRDTEDKKYNHRVAIYGMGGVGKTQLAIEYVHRNKSKYHNIFWISAADQAALLSGFQDIARLSKCVPVLDTADMKPTDIASAVLSWLEKQSGWLLVMDNMDDIEVAIGFLPAMSERGHTLITTRNPDHWTIPAEGLQIPILDEQAAVQLLLLRSRIDGNDDPTAMTQAVQIVNELGCLALAIEQAASFIRSAVNGLAEFLPIFRKSQHQFLGRKLAKSHPYSNSLAATFLISYNKVHDDPILGDQAIHLLRLLAFLNPDGILVDFLRSGSQGLDSGLRQVIEDDMVFHDALELLQRYSLVTLSQQKDAIVIHRLVQAVIKDQLDNAELQTSREYVVCVCDMVFPPVDDAMTMTVRLECRRLQNQVLEPAIQAAEICSERSAGLLLKVGEFLLLDGKYQDSERALSLCVDIRTELLSTEHHDTLIAMVLLGNLLHQSGQLERAVVLKEKIWEGSKHVLGEDHRDSLTSMSNLALTYRSQGKLNRAATMLSTVLDARKRKFGEAHPRTLTSMRHLAETLRYQGKLDQAVAMSERGFEASKRILGEDHLETLAFMSQMVTVLIDQGEFAKAEALGEKVLEATKRILGETHPNTLSSMGSLAVSLQRQGKLCEAAAIELKLLETKRQILGDEHPDTLIAINNAAVTLCLQGNLDQAAAMHGEAWKARKRILGDEHPDTLLSMSNLAHVFDDLGRSSEAKELMQKAVDGSRIVLGEDHPYTLSRIDFLSHLLGN